MIKAVALAAATLLAAQAAGAADLSGIWKITTPVIELKTEGGKTPPLKPAAARVYRARIAQRARGDLSYDPTQLCKPIGEPRVMYEGQPFEIVQTPGLIVFNYQWNRLNRLLYADTTAPQGVPRYFGSGPMHWDGDALVITTSMLNGDTLLDAAGMPHSDALMLTECFRLSADGDMLVETIRFDDPATFTAPWTASFTYQRQSAVRLDEDVCEERMKLYP